MRTTKISLIAALAMGGMLACANIASAQADNKADAGQGGGKKGRGMTVERQLDRMTTELSLNDEVKAKVKTILEASAKKRQELSSLPQDERRTKMREIIDDQDKELKKVLSAEQYTKWEKLREEMRQRRGGQGGQKADGTKKE